MTDQTTTRMGRPAEIGAEQVIEAGEALLAEGRIVSGFTLRKAVGGGDPNRLRHIWERHVAAKSVLSAEPVADLPSEIAARWTERKTQIVESLEAIIVDLNDLAVKGAERRTTEIVRAAQESVTKLEKEVTEGGEQLLDAESKCAAIEAERDDLRAQLTAERQAKQSVEVELAKALERIKNLDGALTEAQQREAGLKQQVELAQQAEQAALQSKATAEGQAEELLAQKGEHTVRIAKLETELTAAQTALAGTQNDLATAAANLAAANTKAETAAADVREARKAEAEAIKQAAELGGELKQAKAELEQLRGERQANQAVAEEAKPKPRGAKA